MAGFDFLYKSPSDEIELARMLLRRVQRIARNLDLRLRYSREDRGWNVGLDGPLPSMQALIPMLAAYSRPFADGFPHPPERGKRIRAAERLIAAYCDAVSEARQRIDEIAEAGGGTSNSYFLAVGATNLARHADEFARTLILFHNGTISASQFAEEAHTMAEILLKACVDRHDRHRSFQELVKLAAPKVRLQNDEIEALHRLKDLRRKAKHQGQRVRIEVVVADFSMILGGLHKLARHVRTLTLEASSQRSSVLSIPDHQ